MLKKGFLASNSLEVLSLIHVLTLIFIFFSIDIPLSPDEAHYALWTKNLDWSYYSKGPILALSIKATTSLLGMNEHAVRLPALIFNLGSIFLIFRFLKEKFSKLDASIIYLCIISSVSFWYQALIITTDSPITFFWILASVFLKKYFDDQNRPLNLLLAATFAIGFGILTKYTILLLAGILFLMLIKDFLAKKNTLGPIIIYSILLGLFFCPIIYWNMTHEWVNILHNSSHVGVGKAKGFSLLYFIDFLGGQIGIFGLFLFVLMFCFYRHMQSKESSLGSKFVIISAAALFFVCLLVSFFKRIYPNWTIPIYPILFLFLGNVVLEFRNENKTIFKSFLGLNFLISFLGVLLLFEFTFGLSGNILPTKKLVGWRDFSNAISNFSAKQNETQLIFTESYDIASELGFYSPQLSIYNIPLGGRRMNQFDIWQKESTELQDAKDKNILLVFSDERNVELIKPYFKSIEDYEPKPYFAYDFSNKKLRTAYLYLAKGFSGKKFEVAVKK